MVEKWRCPACGLLESGFKTLWEMLRGKLPAPPAPTSSILLMWAFFTWLLRTSRFAIKQSFSCKKWPKNASQSMTSSIKYNCCSFHIKIRTRIFVVKLFVYFFNFFSVLTDRIKWWFLRHFFLSKNFKNVIFSNWKFIQTFYFHFWKKEKKKISFRRLFLKINRLIDLSSWPTFRNIKIKNKQNFEKMWRISVKSEKIQIEGIWILLSPKKYF